MPGERVPLWGDPCHPPAALVAERSVVPGGALETSFAPAGGLKAGGFLYAVPLLRQQSQPNTDNPIHNAVKPTTGFLPIGFPFPVRESLLPRPTPARFSSPAAGVHSCQPERRDRSVAGGKNQDGD